MHSATGVPARAFDGATRQPENDGMARHTVPPAYDRIGRGYTGTRRPDSRIAAVIAAALGDARTLVNIGAGAGAYEPGDRRVVAVEPSRTMIAQRPSHAAPCIQGVAERLPFRDRSVDASLAILTIHHWTNQAAGLRELRRVARRRVVVLTWDPEAPDFWLTAEYFPEILDLDRPRFAPVAALAQHLGTIRAIPIPIPHDCQDGFLGAFWRRPEAYLDPAVRGGISCFTQIAPEPLRRGLLRLAGDLQSGQWQARHGHLRRRESLDLGYRLVVAEQG
jgi:SAM-dependent methyltransferase